MYIPEAKKIVAVSGGFDPIHIGHARLFNAARALGDHLLVIVNDDEWLMRKKGYVFMPLEERVELLRAMRSVDEIVVREPRDTYDICHMLEKLEVHLFANGGDRKAEADIPEAAICAERNIEMVFNVGDPDKPQSSSWLIQNVLEQIGDRVEDVKQTGRAVAAGSFPEKPLSV